MSHQMLRGFLCWTIVFFWMLYRHRKGQRLGRELLLGVELNFPTAANCDTRTMVWWRQHMVEDDDDRPKAATISGWLGVEYQWVGFVLPWNSGCWVNTPRCHDDLQHHVPCVDGDLKAARVECWDWELMENLWDGTFLLPSLRNLRVNSEGD